MCFNHVCHKRRKIARICLYKLFASTKMSSATSASDSPPFSSYAGMSLMESICGWASFCLLVPCAGLILFAVFCLLSCALCRVPKKQKRFPFPNPCIDFAVCLCCVVSHPRKEHVTVHEPLGILRKKIALVNAWNVDAWYFWLLLL